MKENPIQRGRFSVSLQVVGGKMTEAGRLGAFITKVKKGSLADVVGHLRAGTNAPTTSDIPARPNPTCVLTPRSAALWGQIHVCYSYFSSSFCYSPMVPERS